MTTFATSHSEAWNISLRDNVFPAVIAGLETKKVKVSIEELFGYLNLSKPTGSIGTVGNGITEASNSGPQVPSYLGGNAATTAASGTANGGSAARRANKQDYIGPTCQYVFSKGAKKGEFCGLPCAPGNPKYCKACSRKKAAGGQGTSSTATSQTTAAADPVDDKVLDAVAINEEEGLYRETSLNLLIKQKDSNTFCLGRITDPENIGTQLRALNDVEKEFCNKNAITVMDQHVTKTAAAPSEVDDVLKSFKKS